MRIKCSAKLYVRQSLKLCLSQPYISRVVWEVAAITIFLNILYETFLFKDIGYVMSLDKNWGSKRPVKTIKYT